MSQMILTSSYIEQQFIFWLVYFLYKNLFERLSEIWPHIPEIENLSRILNPYYKDSLMLYQGNVTKGSGFQDSFTQTFYQSKRREWPPHVYPKPSMWSALCSVQCTAGAANWKGPRSSVKPINVKISEKTNFLKMRQPPKEDKFDNFYRKAK